MLAMREAVDLHQQMDTLPVDIRAVAGMLDVEFIREVMPPRLDGFYFRTRNHRPHICVNVHQKKQPGRVLFTSAHEVGHHILTGHMRLTEAHYVDCDRRAVTPLERACNLFAAELLMPEALIRQWWDELKHNRDYRIDILLNRCGVSNLALQVRLAELGLATFRRAGEYYRAYPTGGIQP